jgi:hypothetical protein
MNCSRDLSGIQSGRESECVRSERMCENRIGERIHLDIVTTKLHATANDYRLLEIPSAMIDHLDEG